MSVSIFFLHSTNETEVIVGPNFRSFLINNFSFFEVDDELRAGA